MSSRGSARLERGRTRPAAPDPGWHAASPGEAVGQGDRDLEKYLKEYEGRGTTTRTPTCAGTLRGLHREEPAEAHLQGLRAGRAQLQRGARHHEGSAGEGCGAREDLLHLGASLLRAEHSHRRRREAGGLRQRGAVRRRVQGLGPAQDMGGLRQEILKLGEEAGRKVARPSRRRTHDARSRGHSEKPLPGLLSLWLVEASVLADAIEQVGGKRLDGVEIVQARWDSVQYKQGNRPP